MPANGEVADGVDATDADADADGGKKGCRRHDEKKSSKKSGMTREEQGDRRECIGEEFVNRNRNRNRRLHIPTIFLTRQNTTSTNTLSPIPPYLPSHPTILTFYTSQPHPTNPEALLEYV
jgi:hypothetical protein